MPNTTKNKELLRPFSEVVFSTNEVIKAECYKEALINKDLKFGISQGCTVKIISSYDNSYIAYGIVGRINNSSLDSIHKPSALGLSSGELEELQPQLYELLKKELEIFLFAHQEKGEEIMLYPPLKPMMIHDFVYKTTDDEVLKLTSDLSTLITLIKKNQLNLDIVIDFIKTGYKLRNHDNQYLLRAGQQITQVYNDDIESLMQVLKRLSGLRKL